MTFRYAGGTSRSVNHPDSQGQSTSFIYPLGDRSTFNSTLPTKIKIALYLKISLPMAKSTKGKTPSAATSDGFKIISDNRKARFLYEILDTYEAGIELLGTEVKSIRQGKVNLGDGYALVRDGEVWLLNVHVSPWETAGDFFNHDPRRSRKLLMRREEIRKLIGKVEEKGLTLVPLKMYFKRGWVKVSIGLGRGKNLHDKRESLKQKQDKRDVARELKNY
jgi:SsrA-binding protein